MAITLIQTCDNAGNSLSTVGTANFGSATTAGHLIEISCKNDQGTAIVVGGPNFTITDTYSTHVTWFAAPSASYISGSGKCLEKYWGIATGGTGNIIATVVGGGTNGTQPIFTVGEYSGIASSGPTTTSIGNNVFVDNVPSGNITATAGNLCVGAYIDSFGLTGGFGTFSSGSTSNGDYNDYGGGVIFAYQIAVGGAVEYTGVGSGGYAVAMITQYPSASIPPSTIVLPTDAFFFGMT